MEPKSLLLTALSALYFLMALSCNGIKKQNEVSTAELNKSKPNGTMKGTSRLTRQDKSIKLMNLFRKLADGDLNAANEAGWKLNDAPVDDVFKTAIQILNSNEAPEVIQETILYCRDRARKRVKELLPSAVKHSSARILNAMFYTLRDIRQDLTEEESKTIRRYLLHENEVVRLRAALLLPGHGFDTEVLDVLMSALSSDSVDTLEWEQPTPIRRLAKNEITSWEPRQIVIKFIQNYKTVDKRAKYHLIDAYAYLKGKTKTWYGSADPPNKQYVEQLDKLAKEFELSLEPSKK